MPDGDSLNFDYLGAKKAGYSDQEIQDHLKQKYNFQFDITGAKNSGYSDQEVGDYLRSTKPPSANPIANEIDNSKNFLQQTYDQNADKTLYNMLEDKYIKGETTRLIKEQSLGVRGEPFKMRFPDEVKKEVQLNKDLINQNPDLARPVIKRIAKDNPDQATAIKKAMYLADASKRDHSTAVVEHNANRIASGDLDYDIDNKQVVKPTGFLDQVFRGIKQHSDAMDTYDFVTSHNDHDIINKLESDSHKYDPDTPVYKPRNSGTSLGSEILNTAAAAGSVIGGNAVPMAKMELPRLLAPVPVVGEAAVGAGMVWGASDFHHTAYANTLQQVYSELRQKKVEPEEALAKAKEEAEFSGNLAAAQGLVLSAAGGKIGKNAEFKPVNYKPGFISALKDIGHNSSELIKSLTPDVEVQSAIAGGVKAIENAHQGKPMGEGVGDAMIGGALFMAGLGVLRAPEVFLNKKAYNNLVEGYSQAPPEVVDKGLAANVQHGNLTTDEAVSIKNEIENHKAANEGKVDVHSPLTPEAEQVLRDVEDSGVPKVMTKALEKIAKDNGIEPAKPAEGKEPEELTPQKVINRLKKRQEEVKLPETFEKKSVSVIKPEENQAPNIVNLKSEDHAIQEPQTSGILQHPQEGVGGEGGGRERVEPSQQGNEPSQISPEKANQDQANVQEKIKGLEAEREAKVREVGKPDVKMDFVSPEELVKSKDPVANKAKHNEIKGKFKELKQLIDCLWLA